MDFMTLKPLTRTELTEGYYIFKGDRLGKVVDEKGNSGYQVLPNQTDIIKILKIDHKYFLFISLQHVVGAFTYHWDECQGKTDHWKVFYDGVFYAIEGLEA